MSVFICPPTSIEILKSEWEVPHPGFGVTSLRRNREYIWSAFQYEECESLTLGALAQWCDSNARWTLDVDGPLKGEVYELHRNWRVPLYAEWRLIERKRGFA